MGLADHKRAGQYLGVNDPAVGDDLSSFGRESAATGFFPRLASYLDRNSQTFLPFWYRARRKPDYKFLVLQCLLPLPSRLLEVPLRTSVYNRPVTHLKSIARA